MNSTGEREEEQGENERVLFRQNAIDASKGAKYRVYDKVKCLKIKRQQAAEESLPFVDDQ